MITATDLEVRAGARTLLSTDGAALRVQPGDRIGLVGRNGAGKTTTMRILAGEGEPYAGTIARTGEIGYLPQDPKEGNLDILARDRVLSARGLDTLLADLEKQQALMAEVADDAARDKAIRRYGQLEERFAALGGYAAESEAGRICASLGLPERVLTQPLRTLSGGQRRRVELSRILFAASDTGAGSATTLLLDEPTNHLDADSLGWLREFLRGHTGGLVVISHNVDLLADVVNRVWFLDAVRGEVDVYNMGWQKYLDARATDEQRRRRERANAERKAAALRTQAAKMGAKATKAVAAQNMLRRADRMMAALDEERVADKVAKIKFPTPAPCGRTPLVAKGLTKNYGSLEVFTGVDLAIDRGSRVVVLGLNGAGKTTLLRLLAGVETPDAGGLEPDTVSRSATSPRNTTRSTTWRRCGRTSATRRPTPASRSCGDCWARSCSAVRSSSSPQARCPAARRRGSRWRASSRRRRTCLLLDEPTNNLDPASREQVLDALRSYIGAVVLVTHDPGAAEALDPQRVVLLPDGTEDFWSDGLSGSHRTRLNRWNRFIISARCGVNGSYAGYASKRRGTNSRGDVDEETEQVPGPIGQRVAQRLRGGRQHPHVGRQRPGARMVRSTACCANRVRRCAAAAGPNHRSRRRYAAAAVAARPRRGPVRH